MAPRRSRNAPLRASTDAVAEAPFGRDDVVRRYEGWYATPYGRVADRIERNLLLELLRPLGPGASVLEVGCGTGHFAEALAGEGFRAFGVDPEAAMLAVARERVPVVRGDGLRLPLADGAVDAAVLVCVLEFVDDPVRLLREARRVARERVALLSVASRSWLGLRRRIAGRLGNPIFARATYRDRRRLVELVRAAGAEPERVRTALLLPPALAGRLPRLEERLSRGSFPLGGVVGLALAGGASSDDRGRTRRGRNA